MTTPQTASPTYKCFRQFNKTPPNGLAASRATLTAAVAARFFCGDSLQDRLVRELGRDQVLPIKEILESGEFFARVRKYVRAPVVADLCCGHGLIGILFALFERSVERVVLIDHRQPPSHARLLDCAVRVGPWVAEKVRYQTAPIKRVAQHLEPSMSVVAAHACGVLTDRCLDHALATGGAIGLMPCCYPDRACTAPPAIQQALGIGLAFDIDRTYRLQAAGYRIRWDAIPNAITPMNRVLIGVPSPAAGLQV